MGRSANGAQFSGWNRKSAPMEAPRRNPVDPSELKFGQKTLHRSSFLPAGRQGEEIYFLTPDPQSGGRGPGEIGRDLYRL